MIPSEAQEPYLLLTGFTDGIVDIPTPGAAAATETLVVEMKHRMGRIQDPPNIYDVVQLCTYCRILGIILSLRACRRARVGCII